MKNRQKHVPLHSQKRSHRQKSGQGKPSLTQESLLETIERLLKEEKSQEAIRLVQKALKMALSDTQKRSLGHCLFNAKHYQEAAHVWTKIENRDAVDLSNIGVAYLNVEDKNQAISYLEASLQQEETSRVYYLLASAHVGKYWPGSTPEKQRKVVELLTHAQELPDCPAEVYYRLADAIQSIVPSRTFQNDEEDQANDGKDQAIEQEQKRAQEQANQILEEGFALYPDNTRIRLKYAQSLQYREQYEAALLTIAPLVQRDDLLHVEFMRMIHIGIESSLAVKLYNKASSFLNLIDVSSPEDHYLVTTVRRMKGDLALAQHQFADARTYYEQDMQSDVFADQFLGLFCCARSYLLEGKDDNSLSLVRQATTLWFNHRDYSEQYEAMTFNPPYLGGYIDGTEGSVTHVKEVCEAMLGKDECLDPCIKGQLSFLLYIYQKNYYEQFINVEWEKIEAYEPLLSQAASLFDHPQVQEELSSYHKRKRDFAQAVYHHLRGCILLYQYDEDGYSEDSSNYSIENEEGAGGEEKNELSLEQCQAIHETAIALLQEYQPPSLIRAVFLPFYRSFWYQILYDRDMHQAIVAVTGLLMMGASEEETTNERWHYAYSSEELGEHDQAEQAYRVYLKYHPDSGPALNNLAVILEEKGELVDALQLMEQALVFKSDEELYQRNARRMKKRLEDLRLENAREEWNQLTDSQKKLLYAIYEQGVSDWQHISLQPPWEEPTSLKEHWEAFLRIGVIQQTAEHRITIDTDWLPLITQEGLLLLICDDIIKATHSRKKNPWHPTLEDFSSEARIPLNKTQCLAFHKAAYSRLQATEKEDLLATIFLPFYRSIWKALLLQKDLFEQVVEVTAILTESLPEYTHSERWDYAYYAQRAGLLNQAEWGYKRYLDLGGTDCAVYHNLSVIYTNSGRHQEALSAIEHALTINPNDEDTRKLKERIEKRLADQVEEEQRQKELEERQRRQYENLIQTAPQRWAGLDYRKRQILGTLSALRSFGGFSEFARLVDMEEPALKGHWKKLVAQGMIIEEGGESSVNPHILELVRRELSHSVVTRIAHASSDMLTKPIFNSQQEYKIYAILLEIFPNQLVFPNMALQTIFRYERMQEALSKEEFGYYLRSSVDFCVTLTSNYLPLVAFEVDSAYHDGEQQQAKDQMKDTIFVSGGVDLIRLRTYGQPSPQTIRYDVFAAVTEWVKHWRATPKKQGWAIDLEYEMNLDQFHLDE